MTGVHVKKEPEDIPSTSHQDIQPHIQIPPSSQSQTISVSVAPNQVTHTLVDGSTTANGQLPPHILTHHDPNDLPTAVQIAQVQGLPPGTHQLTLSNLSQVKTNQIIVFLLSFSNLDDTNSNRLHLLHRGARITSC